MALPIGPIAGLIAALPTLVEVGEKIYSWFQDEEPTPEPEPVKPKRKNSKVQDTTRLTQVHYDLVMEAYGKYLAWNAQCGVGKRMTQQELGRQLNEHFGLSKSPQCYRLIWNGSVNRADLAVGTPIEGGANEGS